jgi:O-antigen ligase
VIEAAALRRALLILLAAALLAFGGTYAASTLPILIASATFFLFARRFGRRAARTSRAIDMPLLAIAAILLLQLVPLPPAAAEWLNPHGIEVRNALAVNAAIANGRAWIPLTIDANATLHACATYLSAVFVFWGARAVFSHGGTRTFCRGLAWFGAGMCLVALAFRATAPRLLYGYWRPDFPGATPFGPYVDRNLFAGWLVLALPLVAGYLILEARAERTRTRTLGQRVRQAATAACTPVVICLALMGVTLLLTLSRGAIAGLAAASLAGWWLASSRLRAGRAAIAVALLALVAAVAAAPDALFDRFERTLDGASRGGRLAIWEETVPIVADFWKTGTGAGAFGRAMLVYQQNDRAVFFNYAHNQYLQAVAEGGVPLALALGWGALAFAGRAWRQLNEETTQRFWIRLGAAVAVLASAVQGMWDAPIQMAGNALLFATAAAIIMTPVTGDERVRSTSAASGARRSPFASHTVQGAATFASSHNE